ncbi:DISARM system phospholipase D-like protein DrmC [Streptomyces cacaoi]|uniref:DISARM system phospholipase D-like protein DrmC n=1 Tax=Streptomyces cacaoi TaxID=1898 RepID=UPI003748CAB3
MPAPANPLRACSQTGLRPVRAALVAMTYAARPYRALTDALRRAVGRGVRVDIVVETIEGASGLLRGPEPAAAFAAIPGVRLWYRPPSRRAEAAARQHAKIAVADSRVLFVGSANLTASAVARNIEAGVLVRGGTAPQRAAEHIRELQRTGPSAVCAERCPPSLVEAAVWRRKVGKGHRITERERNLRALPQADGAACSAAEVSWVGTRASQQRAARARGREFRIRTVTGPC